MRIAFCIGLAAASVAGCTHGPDPARMTFTTEPRGAEARVRTAHATYEGELIAVSDTGFVIVRRPSNTLVFVPFGAVTRFRTEPYGYVKVPLAQRDRERVRLIARHPYGLSPDMLSALLQAHSQAAIEPAR